MYKRQGLICVGLRAQSARISIGIVPERGIVLAQLQLVERGIRPDSRELEAIIHQLTGGDLPRDRVFMLGFSVVAQCLFYLQNRPIIERLYPKFRNKPPTVEQIVEHIYAFSVTAIREFAPMK